MPKHQKDTHGGLAGMHPRYESRGTSVTARRRNNLSASIGERYDRDPCPHALRTKDLVSADGAGDLTRAGDVLTVYAPCVRPASHIRESRLTTAPDPAYPNDPHRVITVTVPDDDARMHSDDAGRVWK